MAGSQMYEKGTSGSPGRGPSRWEQFQEKTGIRTWWELVLSLMGALLIIGILGWGIKGWVELQFQAAAVIADHVAPLESLNGNIAGGSPATLRFG